MSEITSELEPTKYDIDDHYNNMNVEVGYRLDQVWDYIVYKEYRDSKVQELINENEKLKNELKDTFSKVNKLKRKVIKYEEIEENKEKKVKKKRKAGDMLDKFVKKSLKKPKKYKKIENSQDKFKSVLKKLNSIEDIINLEEHPNRFCLKKFEKFKKLYRLIPVLKKLKKLVGMKKAKDQLFRHLAYFLHGSATGNEIMHIQITGPPGVGKTTLAGMLAEIYLVLGFLENDEIIKAKRSDLIGEYCGQTAVKTQKVIDMAEGGVLLLDEAYSLGNRFKKDVFTKECIDTINRNLTEKKGKFLCIIVGYEKELKECFFSYNPGLERRFPIKFKIENYTGNELIQIWNFIVELNEWKSEEFPEFVMEQYKDKLKHFGGDLEIIFNKAAEHYSLRLLKESIYSYDDKKKLTRTDISKAFTDFFEDKETKEMPEYLKMMYI